MPRLFLKQLLMLSLAGTVLYGSSAHAKIVCWTNSDGIRECGNALPPEYAQKESRTINEQGMTTEIKERAKTPQEIAEEQARLAEEQRLQAAEEERRQARENYDQVLLSTYLSEEDITRARDRQGATIDGSIEVSQITIGKLQEKLDEAKKKAANFERQGKPLPEAMQEDINSLQAQIDDKNRYIETKQAEKLKLYEKFEAQMIRFRELKANGAKLH